MKVDELFRDHGLSRDEVLKRIKNAKSQVEKEKWAVYLVKNRGHFIMEEALPDYLKRLKDSLNIQKLGGGAFSQVFQHPHYSNVVVKVYTARDTAYKRYQKWCMAHQSNPYVPQIIGQTEYVSDTAKRNGKFNIVFMEKMTPLKSYARLEKLIVKALGGAPITFKNDDTTISASDLGKISKIVSKGGTDKDFAEVWKQIMTFDINGIDLHAGNVMLRGSQLVFTDPVASSFRSRVDSH